MAESKTDMKFNVPVMIDRLKAYIKKMPVLYYPGLLIVIPARFIRWHLYKAFVKFNRNGLNTTEKRERRVIVSITTFPARINIVPYVIASFLNQTMKPDKIVLWLGIEKFPDKKLPKIFNELKACGVDIEFREDLGPHTKYYYAFKEYPEDIVITFDDDWIYESDVIEKLYKSYLINPDCVSSMRFHKMTFLPDGNEDNHDNWQIATKKAPLGTKSHGFFATGVGAVLYPPHSVHEEAFNIEAMQKLCPKADDVWLKIMEVMNDTKVASASDEGRFLGWIVSGSQYEGLYKTNIIGGQNDVQRKAVLAAYKICPKNGKTLLEMMRED